MIISRIIEEKNPKKGNVSQTRIFVRENQLYYLLIILNVNHPNNNYPCYCYGLDILDIVTTRALYHTKRNYYIKSSIRV